MAKLITLSLISLSSLFIAVCGGMMMYSQGYPMMGYGYGGGMGGGGMGMGMGGGIMSFFTFSKYFTSHLIVGYRKRSSQSANAD